MNRFIPISALVLLTAACAPTKYVYVYSMTKPAPSDNLKWEDDASLWKFSVGESYVSLTFLNKSEELSKIIWDEATMVDGGTALKLIHGGVKLVNRNEAQVPTAVPPHASIDDTVIPSDSIHWNQGSVIGNTVIAGGWAYDPLFPNTNLTVDDLKDMKGHRFQLYLPVDRNGIKTDYAFEFVVDDIYREGERTSAIPPDNEAAAKLRKAMGKQ